MRPGQDLNVLSWTGHPGWLHVVPFSGGQSGWLRLRHLHIVHEGRIYKELTVDAWWNQKWLFDLSKCSIRVSEGSWELTAEDYINMGFDRDNQARKAMQRHLHESIAENKSYTYVSLEVGHPHRDGFEAAEKCHITIAYAEHMSTQQKDSLQYELLTVLREWRLLQPLARPEKLLRHQQQQQQHHHQQQQ